VKHRRYRFRTITSITNPAIGRSIAMTHPTQASRAQDLEVLLRLNRGYVHAAETSDVRWYDEHLADDYMASNPDGSLCDKAGFLERIRRPYPGTQLESVDPRIPFAGELALVHSGFRYQRPDGTTGTGRYTDVYARRGAQWLCISAHFNRN
jgi:hypothetical protein